MPQLDEFLLTAEPSMQRRRCNFDGIAQLRHVAYDEVRGDPASIKFTATIVCFHRRATTVGREN
jgi:hypothetical protein